MFTYMARDGQLYRNSTSSPALLGLCDIYVDMHATGANTGESWENAFTDLNSGLTMLYCDRLCTDAIQRLHIQGYEDYTYESSFRPSNNAWNNSPDLRLRHIIGYGNPMIETLDPGSYLAGFNHTSIYGVTFYWSYVRGIYTDIHDCSFMRCYFEFRNGIFYSISISDPIAYRSGGTFVYPQKAVTDMTVMGGCQLYIEFGDLENSLLIGGSRDSQIGVSDGNMINCSATAAAEGIYEYMIVTRGEMRNCHSVGVELRAGEKGYIYDCAAKNVTGNGIYLGRNSFGAYRCRADGCKRGISMSELGGAEIHNCIASKCQDGIECYGGLVIDCMVEFCTGVYGIFGGYGSTIDTCTATDCDVRGSAISVHYESTALNCEAIRCKNKGQDGAGFGVSHDSVIRGCVARDCTATDLFGAGGFCIDERSTAFDCRAENCCFIGQALPVGNEVNTAGGFLAERNSSLTRCVAENCSAIGGNVYFPVTGGFGASESDLIDCEAINCFADGIKWGGAGGFSVCYNSNAANCHATNCTATYPGIPDTGSVGGFYSARGVNSFTGCSATGCSPCGFRYYINATYANCSASGNSCPSDKPVEENKPLWHCCKQSNNDTNYYNCAECGW